ncbi:MAG: Uncharacterized protein FD147_964 [Chloroflexi bacterium]|nr:MAG: Uncharacterized protein FD147_964 [Chloroflexota bacterium]MBA4375382.1 hypothetical protein [Anaerolinea sp.]
MTRIVTINQKQGYFKCVYIRFFQNNESLYGDNIILKMGDTKVKVVFFDLGFTLINFEGDFHEVMTESYLALARSLISAGCQLREQDFAAKYNEIITSYYQCREIDLIERPVEESLRNTLAFFGQDHIPVAIMEKAIANMFGVTESYWSIESDTHDTLQQLISKGFQLGLISNASNTPDLNRLIDRHDLRKYFECVIISAEEKIRKPDSRIFQRALNRMGVNPENAVMVGDTLTADILGAQQAGMRGIWITRRAQRPENLDAINRITPDRTIPDLSSLVSVIDKL